MRHANEITFDLDTALLGESERLAKEFRGLFSPQTVRRATQETATRYLDARVAQFLPQLIYRFTRERLLATARIEGKMAKDRPEVLFLCVHNAGRSQMAAAFARELGRGRIAVFTAGSAPATEINPQVIQAMREVGLDLSEEFPKPIADEVVRAADVVITMGCGDACPIYPGKKYEDWALEDPAGQPIETVRAIRDEIRARVEQLVRELTAVESGA